MRLIQGGMAKRALTVAFGEMVLNALDKLPDTVVGMLELACTELRTMATCLVALGDAASPVQAESLKAVEDVHAQTGSKLIIKEASALTHE